MLQGIPRQVLEFLILLQPSEVLGLIHLFLLFHQKKKLVVEYHMQLQIDLIEIGPCIPTTLVLIIKDGAF